MVRKLNYFPVKGGLSSYHTTQNIVDQQTLDYNKKRTIAFGEFVQADNDNNPKVHNFADNWQHLPNIIGKNTRLA